jgi:hypothetical protein
MKQVQNADLYLVLSQTTQNAHLVVGHGQDIGLYERRLMK